jgi:hypothetical protein
MTSTQSRSSTSSTKCAPKRSSRRRALGSLSGLGLLAAGCGGSGDLAGVGSGGTGQIASFSLGAISGFGSIIVNGIKFDDSTATVTDDRGERRDLGQLGIGMVVEIDGDAEDSSGQGTARSVRIVSELRGPVRAVNRAAGQFTALGLTIQTSTSTMWSGLRDLTGITPGTSIVEVWGFADRDNRVLSATRIEAVTSDTRRSKLRGVVQELSLSPPTIRIASQSISLDRATIPGALKVGALVQVDAAAPPDDVNPWRVDQIRIVESGVSDTSKVVRLEGRIYNYRSPAAFQLAGLTIDASQASYDGGSAANLSNAVRVRVDAKIQASGIAVATRVRLRLDEDNSEDDIEVKGRISRLISVSDFTVLDGAKREFLVNGSVASIEDGNPSDLKVGASVEIKGRPSGNLLNASQIKVSR